MIDDILCYFQPILRTKLRISDLQTNNNYRIDAGSFKFLEPSVKQAFFLPRDRRAGTAAVRLFFREVHANGLRIHLPEQLVLIKLVRNALPGYLQEMWNEF